MKLEPCPFCGSNVSIGKNDISVNCNKCGVEGPGDENDDMNTAIKKWNNRISFAPYLKKDHEYYSEELAIAISAWMELSYKKTYKPKPSPKKQIENWLKVVYGNKLTKNARNRIATMVNPNKSGGQSSSEPN